MGIHYSRFRNYRVIIMVCIRMGIHYKRYRSCRIIIMVCIRIGICYKSHYYGFYKDGNSLHKIQKLQSHYHDLQKDGDPLLKIQKLQSHYHELRNCKYCIFSENYQSNINNLHTICCTPACLGKTKKGSKALHYSQFSILQSLVSNSFIGTTQNQTIEKGTSAPSPFQSENFTKEQDI